MLEASANGAIVEYVDEGDPAGQPVVFSHSLGANLHLWDKVVDRMPAHFRLIRFNTRGHGKGSSPSANWTIASLADECAALLDQLKLDQACVFVGLSLGGLLAQQLALERPDLVKMLILSNTGARIGDQAMWQSRIEAVRSGNFSELADGILARWLSSDFRTENPRVVEALRTTLLQTGKPGGGYEGCCEAIKRADYSEAVKALDLPVYLIGGSEDGATPPEVISWTASLIPGAQYKILEGAGHLPCVDSTGRYVECLLDFMRDAGLEVSN